MRKTTRVSIILIAVGVLLIIEAYVVPHGGLGSYRVVTADSPVVSGSLFLFRGQTFEGSISANASVNLYVVDETNYLAFAKGNPWQALMTLLDVSNESFDFVAPAAGYYRTIAVVGQSQKNAGLDTDITYYGINLDYCQPGLALVAIGAILITIDAVLYLKSRSSRRPPVK